MGVVKAVVIGDSGVGKTALIYSAINGQFMEKAPSKNSLNFNFTIKATNEDVTFNVWDLNGLEEFRAAIPMYFQGASVIILVFDCTRKETFHGLNQWFDMIQQRADPETKVILVGSKIDLTSERVIRKGEAKERSIKKGAKYYIEVSAKTGEGIKELFHLIANDNSISKESDNTNTVFTNEDEVGCRTCN